MTFVWGDIGSHQSSASSSLAQLFRMSDGWHYGGGVAPSKEVLARSDFVARLMERCGWKDIHVGAGPDGEILLSSSLGEHYLAITVEPDGSFTYNHEKCDVEIEYEEGIERAQLIRRLTLATGAQWNTFDSFTLETSSKNDVSSTTWHSKTRSGAGCLLLRQNAL